MTNIFILYFQCFSEHHLLRKDEDEKEEVDKDNDEETEVQDEFEKLSTMIITNIVLGRCIGEPESLNPEAFMDGIFELYAEEGSLVIHEEGNFSEIFSSLIRFRCCLIK